MTELDPVAELRTFLDQLGSVAENRQTSHSTEVAYRLVRAEEVVDDSLPSEEVTEEHETTETASVSGFPQVPEALNFSPEQRAEVAAVDCGMARLGETEDGLLIALRAAIITDDGDQSTVELFRSGPIYLLNQFRAEALYALGNHLGQPDFFVKVDSSDPSHPTPTEVKRGVANDNHQFADRFRNWFERMWQRRAVTSVRNGTALFDGALTLRTRDTPAPYLRALADIASGNGNSIVAISKQSHLEVGNRAVQFWLSDVPNAPRYRLLTPVLRRTNQARAERVMGNAYAARFSALGPTFRMDVKAATGQWDDQAINKFFCSVSMRGGYPDVLVRAHAHSYFTYPDIIQLQAEATARFGLAPRREIELTGIFAPFGGRFK